jgi:hypothetical protein
LIVILAFRFLLLIPAYFDWSTNYDFFLELSFLLIFPTIINKDKDISLGISIFYVIGLIGYQLLMMFGRGYPAIAKFSPTWQLLSIIDYYMFIYGILIIKGAVIMDWGRMPGGCWLFFGWFTDKAQSIGRFILSPITHFLK